ncbi:MAG: hypothetical protein WDA22_17275 [Bacteroidota bacterium]
MHTTKSILVLIVLINIVLVAQKRTKHNSEVYSGKVAIFYGPNQAEFDSLAKYEDSGIEEVVSDFQYYANNLKDILKSKNIKMVMSSAEIIEVKYSKRSFKFERLKSTEIVGVILCDGILKPKILFGVNTDVDLEPEISSYFKIK